MPGPFIKNPPSFSGSGITSNSIPAASVIGTAVTVASDVTINGTKTFSSPPSMSGASIGSGTIPAGSVVGTAMVLGNVDQTALGIKTFSSPPVLSGASIGTNTIPISAVVGGAMDVSTEQTIAGLKTFSTAPSMSGASIITSTIPFTSVVGSAFTLSGTQSVTGEKTFASGSDLIIASGAELKIVAGATAGYVLTSDADGVASWLLPVNENVANASANVSTTATILSMPIADGYATTLSGTIIGASGTNDGAFDVVGGSFDAVGQCVANAVSIVATPYIIYNATSGASDATFDFSATGSNMLLTVSGSSTNNYNWKVMYRSVTIAAPASAGLG